MSKVNSVKQWIIGGVILLLSFVLFQHCVDPVPPQFDFVDDLIFVDAFALDVPGTSSVSLKRSIVQNDGDYRVVSLKEAKVEFVETNTGNRVNLVEEEGGIYNPPIDFAVKASEVWQLQITLADGRRLVSTPETTTNSVPIDKVEATYDEEVVFDESYDRFIAGHAIKVDFTDPKGIENYYLLRHRTFETLEVCNTCERSVYRGGRCQETPGFRRSYYNYLCETACWKVRQGESIKIYSDNTTDGNTVQGLPLTEVPFYRSVDILVEVQLLSLTKTAFNYFNIINDVLTESSGLNAPPPAALLGNIYDPDDSEVAILGHFTVAAVATKNLFIDRSEVRVPPLTPDPNLSLEPCIICPDSLIFFVCEEGRFRTAIKPDGWGE